MMIWVLIRIRYPAPCWYCNGRIEAGVEGMYCPARKRIAHQSCHAGVND